MGVTHMTEKDPEPTAKDEFVRPASAVFALLLTALWLWESRGSWRTTIPAFLLFSILGWTGGEIHRVIVERRGGKGGPTAWFLVASGTISLVAGSIVWAFGDWRGWRTMMGVVGWAVSTAFWLVLLRLALGEIPDRDPSDANS